MGLGAGHPAQSFSPAYSETDCLPLGRTPEEPPGNDGRARSGQGGASNAPADLCGRKQANAMHRSTTDPDAPLYRKAPGIEAAVLRRARAPGEDSP